MNKFFITGLLLLATLSVKAQSLTQAWTTGPGLDVPECAVYDADNELIYVANIIGKADKKDGLGSISRLKPDGSIQDTAWVRGLHAPKGMALVNGKLYVSDIDHLAIINVLTGKVETMVPMPGALFLNDVAAMADGRVYITDSNKKSVFVYDGGKVTELFTAAGFLKPNGIVADKDGLVIIDMGSGVLYGANHKGKKLEVLAKGLNGGDGIVKLASNEFLVSCWSGEVWHVKDGKTKRLLDTKEQKINAADIGFIPGQDLVLVPTFFGNSVSAYKLKR